ncbi:hypothetical protein [Shouchella lehensis]|nr:hypothetical protein [Shouchella lehensis]
MRTRLVGLYTSVLILSGCFNETVEEEGLAMITVTNMASFPVYGFEIAYENGYSGTSYADVSLVEKGDSLDFTFTKGDDYHGNVTFFVKTDSEEKAHPVKGTFPLEPYEDQIYTFTLIGDKKENAQMYLER